MNQIRISDLNTNDVIEFQNAETGLAGSVYDERRS